jgi:hypothetical protein
MRIISTLLSLICIFFSITSHALDAKYSASPIIVDGQSNDDIWQQTKWHELKFLMAGSMPDNADDFSGQFKISWRGDSIYLLVEIIDDTLIDTHPDPKVNYWDDDCLEVFIDEDKSGGNHLNSYNAFAYHIALDGNTADFGDETDNGVVLLNEHVKSVWKRDSHSPFKITWEVAIKVYNDTFTIAAPGNPITLNSGKVMGFMLAYCDNDGSQEREHFLGSHEVEPLNGDRNRGYIDASVFGKLTLIK